MIKTTVDSRWNGKDVKVRGKKVIGRTAFEIGLVVEGQAKALAPRDTGRLAASITTQSSDMGTAPRGVGARAEDVITKPSQSLTDQHQVLVYVGTPVFYAPYIEFGTLRSNAQPFLRPALDLAQGKTLTITRNAGRYEFADYLK